MLKTKKQRTVAAATAVGLLLAGAIAWWAWPGDEAADGPRIGRNADGSPDLSNVRLTSAPMDAYFAATTDAERRAVLDKVIDEQEASGTPPMQLPAGASEEQIREALKQMPRPTTGGNEEGEPRRQVVMMAGEGGLARQLGPEAAARLSEYVKALRDRRAERGLSPAAPIHIRIPGGPSNDSVAGGDADSAEPTGPSPAPQSLADAG